MAVAATAERARIDFPAVLKDAVLAAVVAFVLAVPLVGLQTLDQGANALGIKTRFDWVAYGTIAVFLGRLAIGYLLAVRARPATAAGTSGGLNALAATVSQYSTAIGVVGVAFAVALPFLPFSSVYVLDVATKVMIYVMLGWGLNVVVGLAGLLDLGYVAFYAVGAYSFALFAQWFHLGFWQALPVSGILAATFGVVLGFPVLRLRGDYLAIVTLGFGEIIRIILINWSDVTGGPNGINGIPRPTLFGLSFLNPDNVAEDVPTFSGFFHIDFAVIQRYIFLYYIILILALITNAFTLRLRKLPIGRAWEALREDEIACRALGLNPRNIKLSAFAIGAMLGGFAGSFFATSQNFISPESFTFIESAIILAIVVLGGMGSQLGVVLAATVLVTLPEFGRELAQFRMLIFGMAMIAIMIWRPRGLLAHREPSLRLHGKSAARRKAAA